jgi:predicted dehydrogenase
MSKTQERGPDATGEPQPKLRIAVVGLGKMGLSHFSLVNAHPLTETVVCDAAGYLVDALGRYVSNRIHKDFDRMLEEEKGLHAVVIATPSRLHAGMVRKALDRGLHVFCEKPFCLDPADSLTLAERADAEGRVNQVGYHYRYVSAFQEMKRVIDAGALGRITYAHAEAYGPVVLRPKRTTWRTSKAEGGGCLYDYAAHPINLLEWFFGRPQSVTGVVLSSIFSADTDDEVYATFGYAGGVSAQLSVNWSDESHRKMSTAVTVLGTNGRLYADRQECRLFLREAHEALPSYGQGWNVRYTTDLTRQSWFYLRGEEYSNQVDDFIRAAATGAKREVVNDFRSAALTDETAARILAGGDDPADLLAARPPAAKPRGLMARLGLGW